MSIIKVDKLHSEDGANSNIELDDSRNVTFKGNIAVDGTIPADKLTGALPAISGASLTGISSAGQAHNIIITELLMWLSMGHHLPLLGIRQ